MVLLVPTRNCAPRRVQPALAAAQYIRGLILRVPAETTIFLGVQVIEVVDQDGPLLDGFGRFYLFGHWIGSNVGVHQLL